MQPKIYLAGPEVFFADPDEQARKLKEICAQNGLEGYFPTDSDKSGEGNIAERIYRGNVGLLDICDAVIANMMPFRGVSMDVGTAFEIGYAVARDMPVFGWSPVHESTYDERIKQSKINDGMSIEDFDITDNLMVVIPLEDRTVHPDFTSAAASAGKILNAS